MNIIINIYINNKVKYIKILLIYNIINRFNDFSSNPKDLKFIKNITKDSYITKNLDNTFCIFESINNSLYLIYTNENSSIISYNLNEEKILNEIKNAHFYYITNFRHYSDKIGKRDLIISISCEDNNIKLWNINNWECLTNIENINKKGSLDSACFLNDNNHLYILSSNNDNYIISESIKVFDIKGDKIRIINDSNDTTYFIDSYYDIKFHKNYIITGNEGYIKSYDYSENKIYHYYYDKNKDNNENNGHFSLIINECQEILKLIDSSENGSIGIWDFHSGELLSKIQLEINNELFGICLWNKNYIFAGCSEGKLILIEINTSKIISFLSDNDRTISTVKKIILPKFGECLISQGNGKEQIKIWATRN